MPAVTMNVVMPELSTNQEKFSGGCFNTEWPAGGFPAAQRGLAYYGASIRDSAKQAGAGRLGHLALCS
jgi:hypothetical protein